MDESSTSEVTIRVASVIPETDAEGPGRRFALWVQGCAIRCDGCFNPHMWSAAGGRSATVDELVGQIASADVEGVTFLGGEPFEQARPLALVAAAVQRLGLSVMTFTGHQHDHLTGEDAPDGADTLLEHTDLLVSGPYVADLADLDRPWVGSTNQEFHFLSGRYRQLRNRLGEVPDRVEVRVAVNGAVSVNGWAKVSQLDDLLAELNAPVGRGRVR